MKFLLAGILSVVGAGRLLAASTNLYINDSTVTYTDPIPPIDATAFVNLSDVTLSIYSTGNPFEITSLQHLTNYGTMAGFPGFLFRYRTNSSAVTKPMSSFENNGIIASQIDLQVNATNILNNGLLLSGDRGYISLQSSFAQTNTNSVITNYTGTINLAGSGLQTGGNPLLESAHTGRSFSGRYTNDLSVFDLYWGAGVNDRLTGGPTIDPRTLAASFRTPVSPSHEVTQIVGVQTATNLFYSLPNCGGTNYSAYQQTSILGVGNTGSRTSVVQVVFVNTNAFYTNVQVQVGFVTSNYFGGGGGWTSIVQFAVSDTSIVDQSPVTSYLYLLDSSLMTSNLNSYDTNQLLSATWRPSNYRLTRGVPSEWLATFPAVPTVEPLQNTEFFYFPLTSTHPRINVAYSAYSAWLGQTNFPWNAAPAVSDPTNYPGKVEIFANQLNTADTRIRSDNYLGITARNVAGQPVSKLPQIDAPFINMDIGTTNPVLLISNTFPSAATVVRLHGQVSAYSAVWSILTTNIAPTTGTNFATNYFSTQYHVLLVDNCLTPQPVNLNKFVAHAKHLDIQDPLTLKASMLLDVQSLNLGPQADLTLPPGWGWGSTNVQGLRSLTNWANLTIPAQANFWDTNFYVVYTNIVVGGHTNVVSVSTNQFDDPYLNFVNHGGITATKIEVRTGYFENSATPNAAAVILSLNGVITLKTLTSQIRDGGILANNKLSLFASELDITNSVLWAGTNSVSGGGLEIAVTNRLSDGGPGANNEWHTSQGIQMDRLPPRSRRARRRERLSMHRHAGQ